MYTITKIGPMTEQEPVPCLQCHKLVILKEGLSLAVEDKSGATVGYIHALCEPAWKEKTEQNPSA